MTLDILEDRRVLSASSHGAAAPDVNPPGHGHDGSPPAHSASMKDGNSKDDNSNGMGSQVREWTHEGIHGQELADRIHHAQAERRGDSGHNDEGDSPPPVTPPAPSPAPGPVDQGDRSDPASAPGDKGDTSDPGTSPTGEHGSGSGGSAHGHTDDGTPAASSSGQRASAPSQSAPKATTTTATPSITASNTTTTASQTLAAQQIARYDGAGLMAVEASGLLTSMGPELPAGFEPNSLEATHIVAVLAVDAIDSGMVGDGSGAVTAGEALEAGVAPEISAVPTIEAIAQFYRWVAEHPLTAWAPWLTAAALAAVAGELSRRQLRARQTLGIAVLPEDIAGSIPEMP